MPEEYFITATAAACPVAQSCSGTSTIASQSAARKATQVDSELPVGATSIDGFLQNSLINPGAHTIVYEIPAGLDGWTGGDAGNWVVSYLAHPFVFGADITLEEVWICRVDSGCASLGTIGKTQGINRAIVAGQKVDTVVAGTAYTLAPSDIIIISGLFNNTGAGSEFVSMLTQKQGDVPGIGYVRAQLTATVASGVPRRLVNGHGQPLLAGGGLVV